MLAPAPDFFINVAEYYFSSRQSEFDGVKSRYCNAKSYGGEVKSSVYANEFYTAI